jgi:hypothetical protein
MVGGPDKADPLQPQAADAGTKLETKGFDPKILGQLVAGLVAWALLRYTGIELPPEGEVAVAAVVGIVAGYFSPAPDTKRVPK